MNIDFHYYATYAASRLAGYSLEEAVTIAHAAGYVDYYVESHTELFHEDARTPSSQTGQDLLAEELIGRTAEECDEILRIWAVFHFLPGNFTEDGRPATPYNGPVCDRFPEQGPAIRVWHYDAEAEHQFRLVCLNDSLTLQGLVGKLVGTGPSPHMIGTRMHTLADTWAHTYFSGMPAWFMNDCRVMSLHGALGVLQSDAASQAVYTPESLAAFCEAQAEMTPEGLVREDLDDMCDSLEEAMQSELARARKELEKVDASIEDLGSLNAPAEENADIFGTPSLSFHLLPNNSALYLGHARALHHPDYGYESFKLQPKWDNKPQQRDNTELFMRAFRQMLHALKCIRTGAEFRTGTYADISASNEEVLRGIFAARENDQSRAWKKELINIRTDGGEALTTPPPFEETLWLEEAKQAPSLENTALWAFNNAARTHLEDVQSILAGHGVYLDVIPEQYICRVTMRAQDGGGMVGRTLPVPVGLTLVKTGHCTVEIPIIRRFISEVPCLSLRINWRRYALRTKARASLEIIDHSAGSEGLKAGSVVKLKTPRDNRRGQQYLGARRHNSLYYETKDMNNGRQKWVLEQDGAENGIPIDFTRPVSIRSVFYAPTGAERESASGGENTEAAGDYYLAPHRWGMLIASTQKYQWELEKQPVE